MEQENEADHLSEHTHIHKTLVSNNNNHNQVTSIDQEMQLNTTNSDLKIDPSTSSYEHVNSTSNNTSNSDIDINQIREQFTVESIPAKVLKSDNPSEINFDMDSDKNSNINNIIKTSLENNHETLKNKSPIPFMKYKQTNIDVLKSTENAIKFKKSFEKSFHCFICDTQIKSLKDWESHAISTFHIEKCMNKNNFVSYDCGGCKTFFFGSKERILKHCKDVHNDISGLPCVFKCMKEVFYHCMCISPTNWKSWSFCGPCKSFSCYKIKCYPSNHIYKKTIQFKCDSCLIDFVCSQEVYNKHLMSCEHIMLEYLQNKKVDKNLETQTMYCLKLPPIILNKFSIDNIKSTCNDCKFQMESNEKALTFHLTVCINKSDIHGKKTSNIKTYFCEVCNITTSNFTQWKFHLLLSSHLIKCFDIKDLVSYTCEICSLQCYGAVHHVTDHQNLHPNNSVQNLSKFMAFNFQRINKDLETKDFYYCEECETYAEVNSNSDHWNKSHKTKLKRIVCKPCRTEFFCIEDNGLFTSHILSSEHIILKSVISKNVFPECKTQSSINQNQKPNASKSTLEKNKVSFNVKPYLQFFQNVKNENNTMCKSCDNLINLNHNDLLSHLLVCNHGLVESIPKSNLNYFQCLECAFYSNNKDAWIDHATTHAKLDTNDCYSYICINCNSLVYGTTGDIELHLITEHKTTFINMPLESVLMAKQLMKRNINVGKSSDIMCFCEPCNMIFKSSDHRNHFKTDSHATAASDIVELFYCKDCKVEFYSSITVYECHKLTAEHIVMSSDYKKTEIKALLKPLKLDTHLFTFVTDQNLYNSTLNIGFFCFICDYLCLKLDVWKIHINSKKHINSSKDLCTDHRCKICKTLMFGKRHHMFEHYSNRFHSMLRQFKLMTSTEDSKQKCETKHAGNMGTTLENDQTAVVNEKPEESSTAVNLLTEMMTKLSHQSNIHKESSLLEDSATKNIHPMTVDEFPSELNFHQDSSVLDESITEINKTESMIKTMDEVPIETNTNTNYSIFYKLKIKMLNELLKQNKEIKSQVCYYCISCDFITTGKKYWDDHNSTNHSNEAESRSKGYCDVCNLYQFGLFHQLDKHRDTIEHKNMLDLKKLSNLNHLKNNNNKRKNEQNSNMTSVNPSDVTQTSKVDKQQTNGRKTDHKEGNNRQIMIEIKDVKPEYKKNSWVEIKKILAFYGLFGHITKHNSITIIFRKLASVNKMLKDKEMLERQYGFTINVIVEADTFGGELSNDLYAQEDLVRYFGKVFRSQHNEYKHIQTITGARVPIVKFFHVPSGLYCDLSFKSGLSTHNTKLVRLYLALDERVHWIVCAVVKRWALQNEMKNQSMFTSYALAWLVLFYLMTIQVVPPLILLREHADYTNDTSRSDVMFIEDWDCTFCTLEKAKQIWKVPEIDCWDLLLGFFKFYSDSNRLKQFVLCPAIGQAIPKDKFYDIPITNPELLGFNKKKIGRPNDWRTKLKDYFHGEGLAVQDPFDLFHNITKIISPRKLQTFSYLCNKTMEVMNNGVQPYYA
ncbi:uncharacterized protein LOC114129116 isoform X2 [Aphis gossypii]|uniref:uncharacterized protein LOC114129116 isoform X2 n=1 Tax=Aphis gossypii TaxID=80765 RepID=UPI0021593AFD|nr:uncharacterized protein LOC114129116 isoform X2 [Aphis gossypii]